MQEARYLCADLVVLRLNDAHSIVNLEEIWPSGAIVESEVALESGASVEIEGGEARFSAVITQVESHAFGWRMELHFSPLTPWSADLFRPLHLFDPSRMKKA